jgi:hypothetical protein
MSTSCVRLVYSNLESCCFRGAADIPPADSLPCCAGGTPHLDNLLKDLDTILEHLQSGVEEQVGLLYRADGLTLFLAAVNSCSSKVVARLAYCTNIKQNN